MLIVIKLFAKDQSELDSPMSSSCELEEEPEESELDDESLLGADTSEITAACLINSRKVAIGVFTNSVEHAFCATLYASFLFFPVHLSWKRK